MAPPLISVAMATYNRCCEIPDAIARLKAQTFEDFEVIVVDDGSTDDTASVVQAEGDERVRYVHRENGGISAARNTGAAASRGRHVIFLDDDDRPDPDWLAAFADVLDDDPALVTCGARFVDPAGRPLGERLPRDDEPWGGLYLAGTFAVRRDLFAVVGGFEEGLQCSHQTELSWRLIPALHEGGWRYRAVARPVIAIVRRAANDRSEADPAKLLSGTAFMLRQHEVQLRAQPDTYANYLSIAGVAAARLGRFGEARGYLWRALRATPGNPKIAGRLLAATIPAVGRRVWRSGSFPAEPSAAATTG